MSTPGTPTVASLELIDPYATHPDLERRIKCPVHDYSTLHSRGTLIEMLMLKSFLVAISCQVCGHVCWAFLLQCYRATLRPAGPSSSVCGTSNSWVPLTLSGQVRQSSSSKLLVY